MGAAEVHAIEEQHVVGNVQVERTAETLDQGDRAGAGALVSMPAFLIRWT